MPASTGRSIDLAAVADPRAVAVVGSGVVWVDSTAGAVRTTATVGGPITDIAKSQGGPIALAIDAPVATDTVVVFWANRGFGVAAGSIGYAPIVPGMGPTGAPGTLASNLAQPESVAVDRCYVYWTGTDGNVQRMRKPH